MYDIIINNLAKLKFTENSPYRVSSSLHSAPRLGLLSFRSDKRHKRHPKKEKG